MQITNPIQKFFRLHTAVFAGAATLALTASLSCAQTEAPANTKAVPAEVAPLRDAFKGQFLIGNAIDYPSFRGQNTMEADIAARHFSALTAANSLKPDSVQHVEGEFRFDGGTVSLLTARPIISRRSVTL